jgi:ABC transporter substrate binding protein
MKAIQYRAYGDYGDNKVIELPVPSLAEGDVLVAMRTVGVNPLDDTLLSYGPPLDSLIRRSAYFVKRILAGVPPRDLPAEQPTKFELTINLKTARAIGVTIPQSVLAIADDLIE